MASTSTTTQWTLEVVRGREVGRRYPLDAGETTLGNAPGTTASHVDLADQEGASPRRMSGRQARLAATPERLVVRDLDSPGGTFVNRQRLLNGQDRALQPGDVIQVGGVQLRVERETAEAPRSNPPQPPPSNVLYTFPNGPVCRSWDDFLTLSAQRWGLVRDELASGRLTERLRRAGRADLAPKREPGQTPDEALDAWLGRLPTSRSSAPELDVHPSALVVRTGAAGGVVRQSLRITNVGYRMLRSTLRVESTTPGRIRLAAEFDGKPLLTIDQTDVGVEIEIPEDAGATTLGTIVVAGNGGTRRIDVRVERPTAAAFPDASVEPAAAGPSLGSRWSSMSLERRFWLFPLLLVGYRFLVGLSGRLPFVGASDPPGLAAPAAATAALGLVIGAVLGSRGGGPLDVAASGFAGLVGGLLVSALGFAAIQTVESLVGPSASVPTLLAAWGLIGAALAAASWIAFPPSNKAGKGGGS